jgi:hypothetical protein
MTQLQAAGLAGFTTLCLIVVGMTHRFPQGTFAVVGAFLFGWLLGKVVSFARNNGRRSINPKKGGW